MPESAPSEQNGRGWRPEINRVPALDRLIGITVVLHLALCLVHGAAHRGAAVPMSAAANLFVLLVILAGPLVGLLVRGAVDRSAGTWLIAATLGASFVFGVLNHFMLSGADHVAHVAAPWRVTFAATALLLMLVEAFGSFVSFRFAMRLRSIS